MPSVRIFVGLALSSGLRRQLVRLQDELELSQRGIRPTLAPDLHVTLKFLSETDIAQLPPITKLLNTCAARHGAFELGAAGVGVFPDQGPLRIVWAGTVDSAGKLRLLQDDLEASFETLGWKREQRTFTPHITLARINDPRAGEEVRPRVVTAAAFVGESLSVRELVLFQSLPAHKGPRYVTMSRHALAAGG